LVGSICLDVNEKVEGLMGKSSLPRLREAPYTYAPKKGAIFVAQRNEVPLDGRFFLPCLRGVVETFKDNLWGIVVGVAGFISSSP
jgi:hypothetical protein